MPEQNPVVKRYLEQFSANLIRVSDKERNELMLEIENHIAEATASGQSVAEVLEKLGPADRLARAYSADVAAGAQATAQPMQPQRGSGSVAGVIALATLPTIIIVPTLGGIGIGFTIGGVAAVLAGIAALFMPWIYNLSFLPFFVPYGVPQAAAIIVGVVLFLMGVGAFILLRWYFKFLSEAMRNASN